MSMTIYSQRRFSETTHKVLGQLFGIFMKKAREVGYLPLDGVARLAGMSTAEWLAIEGGQVPDPSQLELIAAVLGLAQEEMAKTVRVCRGAWD
jgi:hypothetical protein